MMGMHATFHLPVSIREFTQGFVYVEETESTLPKSIFITLKVLIGDGVTSAQFHYGVFY